MAIRSPLAESAFPPRPVTPRVFVEDVIPALFADLELSAAERAADYRVGIVLDGEGGGEWTLHFVDGELGVDAGRRMDCDLSLVQSVADWRSALWENRPAFFTDLVRRTLSVETETETETGTETETEIETGTALRSTAQTGDVGASWSIASGPVLDAETLAELRSLRGRIDIRVADAATRAAAGPADRSTAPASTGAPATQGQPGSWQLSIVLGPIPIPTVPDATISLAAEQAEAIRLGTLHPLEALMTGELRLEGDLGLVFQLQALALRASLAR